MESISRVSSNMQVDDVVDRQIEHYIDRMKRSGFKPCEGLTQGYIESQRIFARVGLIVLALAEAVTQENSNDTASTSDNILRAVKTLKAYCALFGMRKVLGDVPEILQLQSSAKERNNLYAVSFDDCTSKSIAWCVASLIRIYTVSCMYDIDDTPNDSSTRAFIDFAKKVLVADYDIHSFNYGTYQRSSRPMYARKIPENDRRHPGTHGPMDKFVGSEAEARQHVARPAAIQAVVDLLGSTQDTLSELLTPGRYNSEQGVTITIASAYDSAPPASNTDSANSLAAHVSGLCSAVSRIQPDSTYTHKASQYEQNSIFYNIPRNVRGQCIYKYSSRAGGRSTWEIQHKITNQSYLEDVGCAALGHEALLRMSNVIRVYWQYASEATGREQHAQAHDRRRRTRHQHRGAAPTVHRTRRRGQPGQQHHTHDITRRPTARGRAHEQPAQHATHHIHGPADTRTGQRASVTVGHRVLRDPHATVIHRPEHDSTVLQQGDQHGAQHHGQHLARTTRVRRSTQRAHRGEQRIPAGRARASVDVPAQHDRELARSNRVQGHRSTPDDRQQHHRRRHATIASSIQEHRTIIPPATRTHRGARQLIYQYITSSIKLNNFIIL